MRIAQLFVILLVFYILGDGAVASQVSDTDVCPRYEVTPGDTIASISVLTGFDVYSISVAVEACGKRISPLSMGVICLPGGDYPGCKNVGHFRKNGKCPYYILQQGDTVDSIATSLNMYLPDVEQVNSGMSFESLAPEDLIKLPPWDEACGDDFPKTQRELAWLPPAPPPPPAADVSVVSGDGEVVSCEAYKVRTGDTIFSIAATFGIPVSVLMDRNPDIAGGAPLVEGLLVTLSDKKECDQYDILDGLADITASLSQPPPAPPPPPPGPRQVGVVTNENPMVYNDIVTNEEEYTIIDTNEDNESSDGGPVFQNIVSDEVPADGGGGSGPGVGVYIMIGFLCFLLLSVIILMSIAISNSSKKHGNQEKRRKPMQDHGDDGSAASSSGSDSDKHHKLSDDDNV